MVKDIKEVNSCQKEVSNFELYVLKIIILVLLTAFALFVMWLKDAI
jgi:hypothetical protein